MELISKTAEEVQFTSDMNISLANAIRRSVSEIPILAIYEADIYKNDSVLYDEIIAHRLGLIPLKNQKLKSGQNIELKLQVKSKEEDKRNVLSGDIDGDIVYPDMPLVLLENGQTLKLVARANVGFGKDHPRYNPGVIFYRHVPRIAIKGEGEKQSELAELYPLVFSFESGKLQVKNAHECTLDSEDFNDYPGVDISFSDSIVFSIESWGQIEAKEIFTEACKALKSNISEVTKVLK